MTSIQFCEKELKPQTAKYRENVLEYPVNPLNYTLFNSEPLWSDLESMVCSNRQPNLEVANFPIVSLRSCVKANASHFE